LRTVRRQEIDLVIGRYIQSDPIGFDGGINTYLYANGNSLRFVDEMGLFCAGGVCVDDFFGIPNDVTKDTFSEISKIEPKKILMPLPAFTGSFEAHFIIGGGIITVVCTNCKGEIKIHNYFKICLGAAIGASASIGIASNSQGKSCDNPPKKMLGVEVSADAIAGMEASYNVDISNSSGSSTGLSKGGAIIKNKYGAEAKATSCYYGLIK